MNDSEFREISETLESMPPDRLLFVAKALAMELERMRKAIRENAGYRSNSWPNKGRVLFPKWAKDALND